MQIATAQSERNVLESAGGESRGWDILRTVIAAILLVGVATKVLSVAEIVHGEGLLANRWLLLSVIAVEAAISVYVLLGNPLNAWRLTVITFGLFSAVSAYTIATGQACNCFGSWFNSKFIVALDLAVLVSAAMVRPRPKQEPSFRLEGDHAGVHHHGQHRGVDGLGAGTERRSARSHTIFAGGPACRPEMAARQPVS